MAFRFDATCAASIAAPASDCNRAGRGWLWCALSWAERARLRAALAVAYRDAADTPAAHAGDDLLVVVCGGATAGIGQLQAWQATVT